MAVSSTNYVSSDGIATGIEWERLSCGKRKPFNILPADWGLGT